MSSQLRVALYSAIFAVVAVLGGYGLITGSQGAALSQLLVLVLGVAYAALNASGNRLLDPATRRAIYLLIVGAGAFSSDFFGVLPEVVSLWVNVGLAALGMVLAVYNVDPAEVVQTVPGEAASSPEPRRAAEDDA